jgi:hypothetical protein|eukprot:COSAG06_NODE_153_length_21876_cov_5.100628_10_plen_107_part_00
MFVPSLSWQNDGVFIYKWLKSAVFSQAAVHAEGIQRNMVRKRIWSPHFAPLSFYQDRLGTNIRKGSTLKKRAAFLQGRARHGIKKLGLLGRAGLLVGDEESTNKYR